MFEKINEGGTKVCPKCGKKRAERRIGAGAGLIFKGSGFYVTDSKGPSTAATSPAAEGSPGLRLHTGSGLTPWMPASLSDRG